MKKFLEMHQVTLTAIGPVFIGSGKMLMKKEYILDKKNRQVSVVDLEKFFQFLNRENKLESYEQFVLKENAPLHVWLKKHGIVNHHIKEFTAYVLDSGDLGELNRVTNMALFQKDPYGRPYIPGSSLKGALRTIVLGNKICSNLKNYEEDRRRICAAKYRHRASYLSKEMADLERRAFSSEKGKKNSMCGLRISDSKPLSVKNLTLCQKVDVDVKGKENDLPIVRECLKPGTEVQFTMTIDQGECDFSVEEIRQSINIFLQNYNELFLEKFSSETLFEKNVIYLGGGAGFVSKTVLHPLLKSQPQRVRTVSRVIDSTLSRDAKNKHKHFQDERLGVSPHVCKLTQFEGRLYQMGACRIEIV